jgi:prolyl 4-hydroxylase
MKRVEIADNAKSPHFIGSWFIEPAGLCDDLISLFEANTDSHKGGKTYDGLNEGNKKSTDLTVMPRMLDDPAFHAARAYIELLYECYRDYLEQWPFIKTIAQLNIGPFNIQRYESGGHFKLPHAERSSLSSSHRVFAWMTYLNDVPEGGSTYFPHYDLDIQPEKGKTLIWPAEWTHAHYGNLVTDGRKYIITGWMHFPQ